MFNLVTPDLYSNSLAEVDLEALYNRGIRFILLDLDNTILPWRDYTIPTESAEWVKKALDLGMKVCIASNTRNPRRMYAVSEKLGVPCLDKIAKPRRTGLRAAIRMMGGTLEQSVIIGDQIFTDIVGGNRLRIMTILVRPMHPREFIGTKISRLFEKPILALLARRGIIGTKQAEGASELQD